jgi:hypothetical protein
VTGTLRFRRYLGAVAVTRSAVWVARSNTVFGLLAAGPRGAWLADEATNSLRLIRAR